MTQPLRSDPGPVSQVLEAEICAELGRQKILVWLDTEGSFTAFTDALAARSARGAFPYPVITFRGSFLETLFALETHGSGYDPAGLLVHMPGFTTQTIRKTPVLELYEAGTRFQRSLDTLVRQAATGRVAPDAVDELLKSKPTLESADTWLARSVSTKTVGLAVVLAASGPALLLEGLAAHDSPLARLVGSGDPVSSAAAAEELRAYVHALTGMDQAWFDFAAADTREAPAARILEALGSWLLCVEYVHDLRRDPHLPLLRPLRALATPLVKECAKLLGELRDRHGDAYERIADDAEAWLDDELGKMTPEDLGQIDTFRREEVSVFEGAIKALGDGQWKKALDWCTARHAERSFWLRRNAQRRREWNLVAEAARFGATLADHDAPFKNATTHHEMAAAYADKAHVVDRAHRRFEQERLRLLDPQLPSYASLEAVTWALRRRYRDWADELSIAFNGVCKKQGFLPPEELRQRSLYDQVVQPLTLGGERVVVFLLDAFRFEMAAELAEQLRERAAGGIVDLKPRYAELPTITKVGMNVLPPVARDGRIRMGADFEGAHTGEYTVKAPLDRARAMGTRSTGKPALLLWLHELTDDPAAAIKKLKDHKVIMVQSTEIDDAGEANVGLHAFEAQLGAIKAAWHHLQAAGIKQAVFTADHGFLLQDSTSEPKAFGNKRAPQRRYVLDPHERGEDGMVPVPVASLGYDGVTGFLLFREDTRVWDTGGAGGSFVHGGNSPEERIIPVLTVTRKRAEKASLAEYAVEAEALRGAFGFHRVQLRVVFPRESQTSLGFAAARSIELELRAPDAPSARALIKEVSGAGTLKNGRIVAAVGEAWTEVFFALEDASVERCQIEIYHPDHIENVRPTVLDSLFDVVRALSPSGPPPPVGGEGPSGTSAAGAWAASFEDEAVRAVFLHVEAHGSITESELIAKLGTARAARKFALAFEDHKKKLPFKMKNEPSASGKRYVRVEG